MDGYRKTKLVQNGSLTISLNYVTKGSPGSRSPSALLQQEKEEMETEHFTLLGGR